eukprot:750888-Hanusia_phi.AAC.2
MIIPECPAPRSAGTLAHAGTVAAGPPGAGSESLPSDSEPPESARHSALAGCQPKWPPSPGGDCPGQAPAAGPPRAVALPQQRPQDRAAVRPGWHPPGHPESSLAGRRPEARAGDPGLSLARASE